MGKAWKEDINDELLDEKCLVSKTDEQADLLSEMDDKKNIKNAKYKHAPKKRSHSVDELFKYVPDPNISCDEDSFKEGKKEKKQSDKQYDDYLTKER